MGFDERAAIERFWQAHNSGKFFPAEWNGRLGDRVRAEFTELGAVDVGIAR